MTDNRVAWRRWLLFGIVSIIFFHITGSTFTSLGVVLPYMIEELSWSWTHAGLGFTLLALMTGLASTVPAWTLRRLGIKATYGIGGVIMAAGFTLLALADSHQRYFLGASLLGLGFPLCASVPAVHLINNWLPDKRSFAIGAYMMIGGLGGVAGPLVVTGIVSATGSWRIHWWTMTAVSLVLVLIAIAFVKSAPDTAAAGGQEEDSASEKRSDKVYQSAVNWSLRETMRTPQYYVIVAAMTMTLFCGVTMNTWAVAHLGTMGVSASIARPARSAPTPRLIHFHAFSAGRWQRVSTPGGSSRRPSWRRLSVCWRWPLPTTPFTIALFAIAEGYGFGMCLFTTTVLLVKLFRAEEQPGDFGHDEPDYDNRHVRAGNGRSYRRQTGRGFDTLPGLFPVVLLIILIFVVSMRPPR